MTLKEWQTITDLILMVFGLLNIGYAAILEIRRKPSFEAFVVGMLFLLMGKN